MAHMQSMVEKHLVLIPDEWRGYIEDLRCEGEAVSFDLRIAGKLHRLMLLLPETYPNGNFTLITPGCKPFEEEVSLILGGTLNYVIVNLCTKYCTLEERPLTVTTQQKENQSVSSDPKKITAQTIEQVKKRFKDNIEDLEFNEEGVLLFNLRGRNQSFSLLIPDGYPKEEFTLCVQTEDQQDVISIDPGDLNKALQTIVKDFAPLLRSSDGEEVIEKHIELHPQFQRDLKRYQDLFGPDSISYKVFDLLETVEVEMLLRPIEILSTHTLEAWGMNPSLPVVVKITVFGEHYTSSPTCPTIEIYQTNGSSRTTPKLTKQIEGILKTFITTLWTKRDMPTQSSPTRSPSKQLDSFPLPLYSKSEEGQKDKKSKKGKTDKKAKKAKSSKSSDKQLVKPKAKKLKKSKRVISNSSESVKRDISVVVSSQAKDAQIAELVGMGFDPLLAAKAMEKFDSIEQAAHELLEGPDKIISSNVESTQPTYGEYNHSDQFGLLVTLMSYIKTRIPTLSNHCVICDQPHVFLDYASMLKPSVCSRDLCCWSFQQLGVGADSADDIATGAEVIDLLICMCTAAARSTRSQLILDPFPTIFDPNAPKEPILSPNKKDFQMLLSILNDFPAISSLVKANNFSELKLQLERAHKYAYSLLQWVIGSNRCHIVKLPSGRHLPTMRTPHQYLLLSSAPEKEAIFRKLKNQYPSTFAFHGSPIENWHSILRRGLINASGTKFQIHGASYGSGIYLSPNFQTSSGYVGRYSATPTPNNASENIFLNSGEVYCMALCEVIDKDIKRSGDIWVVPNPDHVCTRFFFVFTTEMAIVQAHTSSFFSEIKGVLAQFGL